MRPHDTSQEAHEFQIRGYRRMDAGQKARLVADLSEAVRDVARESRMRSPGRREDTKGDGTFPGFCPISLPAFSSVQILQVTRAGSTCSVPYDSPGVVEERDEHPSKLAGDGQEFARDPRKQAVDTRERVGER